ncbi:UDP-N-acetylmuramoyl-L-alanyl-D-glutamate--2,6-diaminopimelate ligase [Alkalibacter rhizosphaerae]|uniref:UDP-N-acetylmuramoyl-L-alanyl-D-glutamate--2,6-diaminopimelate ligase n=1 Tax=Alkalibacter rhizosphaerae TaxID=2815577 RepID=A0A974XFJ3_9FIRM|nr:UDP-N-acetylmuramoyl-L-alanyl-D-glutamate--2,6-diaminopimelate ligase [Alkalibacter rhizosphaerae]QSX08924.1 UDP-N-acetylmuramoyl-L-alanyl-D-glutamate--2,6-diaminopimelate ligase [Alkalibacter rhizosphaerae]
MKLSVLFQKVHMEWFHGDGQIDAAGLCYDSRTCKKGDVFFAIGGFQADGNAYIEDAVRRGAVAVVSENRNALERTASENSIPVILVKDVRRAMSAAAACYHGYPSNRMKVIGITGTNGKSSTAFFLKELLEDQGRRVGIIGTLGNYFENWEGQATHTTPESVEIHGILKEMADLGAEYCLMEVSSHALALYRVEDVSFHGSIFTNISQDHLDFHHTMEEYFIAKEKLFRYNQVYAVINTDDPYGRRIHEGLKKTSTRAIGFGMDIGGEFLLNIHQLTDQGGVFSLKSGMESIKISTNQVGAFNMYNLASAVLAGKMESLKIEGMMESAKRLQGIRGRMEKIQTAEGFGVIIDFAHTPDGLEKVLKTLRETSQGRIITVFGCGGDRDRQKRPVMGSIAVENSDFVIVTSDNPRGEDPSAIIGEIEEGMKKYMHKYTVSIDRKDAIGKALKMAKPEDLVLIAGKGHETLQIIGDKKLPFDERAIVKELLDSNETHKN